MSTKSRPVATTRHNNIPSEAGVATADVEVTAHALQVDAWESLSTRKESEEQNKRAEQGASNLTHA